MIPFERRTTHQQRESIREELHDLIDTIVENWSAIEHEALAMAKGFSANTLGDGGGNSNGSSRTETLAAVRNDPGDRAARWITDLTNTIQQLRQLHGRIDTVLPDHSDADKMQGRKTMNDVENCQLCRLPAPKVKRIDGLPYCATSCYYKVWRGQQKPA